MFFTQVQRQELNALSKLVFGSESKWQKLLAHPDFRIPTGETVADKRQYFRTKTGTVMRLENAKAKGLAPADYEGASIPKQLTKAPDFDALKNYLSYLLDERALSTLEHDQMSQVMAHKFAKDQVTHLVKLIVDSEDDRTAQDIATLIKAIPEGKREMIEQLLANSATINGIELVATTFLGDYVFSINHVEESEKLFAQNMDKARTAYAAGPARKLNRTNPFKEEPVRQFRSQRAARRFAQKQRVKNARKA